MAGVASKNPFALLGDEDSSPPSTPAPAKSTPSQAPPPPTSRKQQQSRSGPASRGGKYYARGGARSIEANPNQDGTQEPLDSNKRSDSRGRGRGGRGGRGGHRSGGPGPRPDRHSQTGKTDSDKKIHQSWGGDDGNTELKDELAASNDAAVEANDTQGWGATSGDSWDAPSGGDAAAAAATGEDADKPARKEREPEAEDNTLTLDQYLAQQKEKETVVPAPLETRQVASDWKDVKPLEKSEDDAYFVGKTKAAPKARTQQAPKGSVEVNFAPPPREGGRGRGRGRGGDRAPRRGGGDRGGGDRSGGDRGGRGGRQNGTQPALNVDDTSVFPALS